MKLISITILSLLISFTTINSDIKPLSNQETTGWHWKYSPGIRLQRS